MKRQIIAIHGGDAFPTYKEYLESLRNHEINFENLNTKGWKRSLGKTLGENYGVVLPEMPNSYNAKYIELCIWFEKFFSIIKDDVILVGHSMGGSFLAKYLSENDFPQKIRATFLVAAPYNMDEGRELVEFCAPDSLERLVRQGEKYICTTAKMILLYIFQN